MLDRRPSGHWDWLFDPNKYGTDEQGRRIVNAHGDVDVVRSEHTMHAVQLPVEPGCIIEIDGQREKLVKFVADSLVFIDPDDEIPEVGHPGISTREGVQHFNTRVRDANEVKVIQDG